MQSWVGRSLNEPVDGVLERSRSALNHWIAACRPGLRKRAAKQLPRELARKEDASDLVQRVLYRGTAQIDRFRGRSIGEFYQWLARIQDKQVLKVLRRWLTQRRNCHREKPLGPAVGDAIELAASSMSISERLCRDEESERLHRAMSWCREEDRAVIVMHLFEARSHVEIADRLGIAPVAVRQRYCRAVRRVGEAMTLLEQMSRSGFGHGQQAVIGIHRFQAKGPRQIADLLRLPEDRVARWIEEAKPLFRPVASRDEPCSKPVGGMGQS